jgi:hypothetical protein
MSALNDKLRASKAQAVAAKEAFQAKYAADREDRAVGIGLNRSRSNWAVKVYAKSETASSGLPDQFRGYEVDVELTGRAVAHR